MINKSTILIVLGFSIAMGACKNGGSANNSTSAKKDSVTKTGSFAKTDSSHLVGMWLDADIKTDKGEQVAYQIVTQGPKTYIQVITFTGKKLDIDDSPAIAPSAAEISKKENRYVSVNNAKEIYQIEKTGDLLIYDETGFIAKCKKLL